jgi:hypothetical protein
MKRGSMLKRSLSTSQGHSGSTRITTVSSWNATAATFVSSSSHRGWPDGKAGCTAMAATTAPERRRCFATTTTTTSTTSGRRTTTTTTRTNDEAYCVELVQRRDREAYYCGLLLPARYRDAYFALRAFNVEIASIKDQNRSSSSSSPGSALALQLRMQWWRDAVASLYEPPPQPPLMSSTPAKPI